MKKILNILLVIAVTLVQLIPTTLVNAAETGTITITNAVKDETYSIYKILELDRYDTTAKRYIYQVTDEKWEAFINDTTKGGKYLEIKDGGAYAEDYVVWKSTVTITDEVKATFAKEALAYAEANGITPTETKKAESETLVFDELELGYYLVDSSLGTLCNLTTTAPSIEIQEKNTTPTVEKKVQEETVFGDKNDAKIGDTVNYETTITVGTGTINYVLHDTLSDGLTLDAATIKVYVGGTEVANENNVNYTITTPATDGHSFDVKFENSYISSLTSGTKIVVKYSAVLNEEAVIKGEGNPNETWLTYGDNQESTHDKTITYTYDFELIKTDSENVELEGAEFKLYGSATGTDEIKVVLIDEATNTYRVAKTAEELARATAIKAGKAIIRGLDSKTYYLEETVAPTGYNKLTSRVPVTVKGTSLTTEVETTPVYEATSVSVVNLTGTQLPSTGGFGTTLFISIGSVLVLGFGVLLVTKLRMSKISA